MTGRRRTARALIRRRAWVLYGELLAALFVGVFAMLTDTPMWLGPHEAHTTAFSGPLSGGQIAGLFVGAAVVIAAAGVLLRPVLARLVARASASSHRVDRLADPTRWPCCSAPVEAHDDPFTPHYCALRAER